MFGALRPRESSAAVHKLIEYANREERYPVKILVVLVMTLMPALALGSNARVSKNEILSTVETAAKASCHNVVDIGRPIAHRFSRCELTARFDVPTNTWNVIVGYVYKDKSGKDVSPAGAWTIYVLSPQGKLLQTLPGE